MGIKMSKEHKKQEKYVKVPKKIWDEAMFLLNDSENYLDWDFDHMASDKYLDRMKKLLEKIDLMGEIMGKKRKKKVVFDKEKSDLYGSARIELGRKGFAFKDKKKYDRKKKHKRKTFEEFLRED
jgi:hypothetical protein